MKDRPFGWSDVSRETRERLDLYVTVLQRWNGRINLIGTRDPEAIRWRHIADALQLVPLMGAPLRAIDLGSGAGLPGLVLAIVTGVPFTLIEADRRKAAFLMEAARATAAPVTVVPARIEASRVVPATLVTARALAPLRRLLHLAAPFITLGGVCVFPKGERAEEELTDALTEWQMTVERFASRTAPRSTIFRISEIAHAGGPVPSCPA